MFKTSFFLALLLSFFSQVSQAQQVLNVLNWSEYIDPDVVSDFEQKHNAKINYTEFESVEQYTTEFFAKDAQFDVTFPGSTMLNLLIENNLIDTLDKSQLSHYNNLSKDVMKTLANHDKGNQHSIPYMWGTTGLGVNTKALKKLGLTNVQNSWSLIFDERSRKKIKSCGMALLNERDELFSAALTYLGYSVNTTSKDELRTAGTLLKETLTDAIYLHTSQQYTDLASGKVCVIVGYSGDVIGSTEENTDTAYFIPREGAPMWVDVMTISKNSTKKALAHAFINHLLDAKSAAKNSNFITYPTPVVAAEPFLEDDILSNPIIYPPQNIMSRLQAQAPQTRKVSNIKHRLWVKAICSGGKWCTVPMKSFF